MSQKNSQMMRLAIRLSIEPMRRGLGGPFGAVVVRGTKVVGRGYNQVTSQKDPTAHAEILAIREACKHLHTFNLDDCDLYTSCEPCPMCLSATYWAHIRRIFYANTRQDAANISFNDALIDHEILLPMHKRRVTMKQVLHSEALVAFKEWKAMPNKILY